MDQIIQHTIIAFKQKKKRFSCNYHLLIIQENVSSFLIETLTEKLKKLFGITRTLSHNYEIQTLYFKSFLQFSVEFSSEKL